MSEQNPTKNEKPVRVIEDFTPTHVSVGPNGFGIGGRAKGHRMEKATPDNYETGTKREGETLTRAHQPPEFDLKK